MTKTKPIPPGFHTVTPHLVVKGAAKAIDFYKKAFGAEEISRMLMDDGKIMHAALKIGDSMLFICDEFPNAKEHASPTSLGGSPITLHLYVDNVDAAFKRACDAGAKVAMPLNDMFWGDRYGQVIDPFGHHWSLGSKIEELTPEEINKRKEVFFAKMAQVRT